MRKRIEKVLKKSVRRVPYRPDFIVGAGGTFTSLARVALSEGGGPGSAGRFPFAVRGCELRHKTVLKVLNSLRRMSLEERCRVPGLSSKRAEIIVAGLSIVERLMEFLEVDRLLIHDGGIRDGLVAEMIDELGFRSQHPRTHPEQVLGAVSRFAERVRFPRDHSEHVARLALRIFDDLAEVQPDSMGAWARPGYRDLLHSAALLHDVGRRISRKAHHKHSYDMIVHADLATLTRREIEIIANTCRYHRKAGPRRGDPGFRKLGADDQRLVAHLAGILRVADGLDYSQKQNVRDVAVRVAENTIVFEATASDDAKVELRRAASKADVFESAFHTQVKVCVRAQARDKVTA
jgi:exopolyphosphatase/guanosine-5'-triphosphate,3'-diphosphate pyrophosphatase